MLAWVFRRIGKRTGSEKMTERIVVLDPISQERADELRDLLPEGFILECGQGFSDEDLKATIVDADYAISGQVGVSGDVLRFATRLKLLHKWGVGVDNLDLATAQELGIKVARTTGSNALSVAEYTIGLIITTLRGIGYGHHHLKGGDWRGITKLPTPTYQLSGKTVGIIGFGAIGQNVARLLRSFNTTVLYAKRSALASQSEFHDFAKKASIEEIIKTADIICLHCPLTEETKNLIGEKELKAMKPTASLINVARGGVVDEGALFDALQSRQIHGAAMDVFMAEPLPPNHPLLTLDNIVVTPHLGAVTKDTFEPTVSRMFDNIVKVSNGLPVPEKDLVVS